MQDRTGYPDKCPCRLSLGNLMVIMQRISFLSQIVCSLKNLWYLCWNECLIYQKYPRTSFITMSSLVNFLWRILIDTYYSVSWEHACPVSHSHCEHAHLPFVTQFICIFSSGHYFGPTHSSPPIVYRPRNLPESLPRLSALPASFSLSLDLDNRSYSQGDSDSSTSSGRFSRHQSLGSSLPNEPSNQKQGKSGFSISNMFKQLSSKKSRLMVLPLSQAEVNDRIKKLLNSAVDIVVNAGMGCVAPHLALYFFMFTLFKVWYNTHGFTKLTIILITCMPNHNLFIYWQRKKKL